jgi:hypothetical protein
MDGEGDGLLSSGLSGASTDYPMIASFERLPLPASASLSDAVLQWIASRQSDRRRAIRRARQKL